MNYPEELRERYNEVMYDERDIIQRFLEKQYDIRYGRQRDTWHFEPAIEMIASQGSHVLLHDIKLDEGRLVVFYVEAFCDKNAEWECFDFAYGELSKVIEALPDVNNILIENAKSDIADMCNDNVINLEENPFRFFINGLGVSIYSVNYEDGHIKAYTFTGKDVMDETNTGLVLGLRNYINIEVLHRYDEYKKLVKFLSEQPNLRFEPADWGHVMFTIHGTDVKVDVLSASLDSNDKLQLCVDDDNKESIYLEEKDIRPEYLVDLVGYIEDHCRCDIMDTYNGHNPELVRRINDAWKSPKYNDRFGDILFALGSRDKQEIQDKFDIVIDCNETAMDNAHEIMEGVCDDLDLQTILSFIRYEE